MTELQKRKKKTKEKKPIYILLGFIIFFGLFIYGITRPSEQSKAIKELTTSFNKKDVEMVWYKYKSELYQDDEFLLEVRKKLSTFNLSESEIKDCISWLPPANTNLNLIVIPDLSRRITDTINNPNQINNDILLLKTIWESFVSNSKLKQDTKDRLIIDVTDIDAAKGQFGKVANNLQFDLSNHKGKSNRLFFTNEKNNTFEKNIIEMYALAKQKPLGADYRFYLRRYLENNLKKSTLFDNYKNKVIIITDGYLEAENKPSDTKIYGFQKQLYNAVTIGNISQVITNNNLNIPKVNIDLSNTEFFVCEVNERKTGKTFDFEILKAYWEDWFKRMDAKKIEFYPREKANDISIKRVSEFIAN
ncbi:hypothetical protein [Flavobacterium crassostreae]|uniref:VWFA domain-containing protein n=1 Tax=Flavobacterium crassostreae TaxID=1763534 RepID=A0A1B9DXU1_9FLAO|nr:hypothetical protein [Flavobacterium crassostreae]OCB74505.1 hypothetical protein LPBF_11000 [Flavobacterium crassostreae]